LLGLSGDVVDEVELLKKEFRESFSGVSRIAFGSNSLLFKNQAGYWLLDKGVEFWNSGILGLRNLVFIGRYSTYQKIHT
jgi:hypothetical protein